MSNKSSGISFVLFSSSDSDSFSEQIRYSLDADFSINSYMYFIIKDSDSLIHAHVFVLCDSVCRKFIASRLFDFCKCSFTLVPSSSIDDYKRYLKSHYRSAVYSGSSVSKIISKGDLKCRLS